ncbi:hypothetical protein F4677DRAFT_397011 [Hypoxylon crocopeplum]|nr:hypothetical protein F4677DRAFT_397011 [Hypoxylon crocopeplum]
MNHFITTASLAALSLIQFVSGSPRAARWSDKTLGPDGPWNAIAVTLGDGQDVTVYPGKMWESFFPGKGYCSNTSTAGQPCYAQQVGAIYDETKGTGKEPQIAVDAASFYTSNLASSGTQGTRYTDKLHLGTDTSVWSGDGVDNFDMVIMSDTQIQYPNGNKYPLFAGCLSFGAAPGIVNQTFQVTAGQTAGAVNMSMLAGTLFDKNAIDSQTFGMHIGSVAPQNVPGSLWFGGYDRNRAVNDMLAISIAEPYFSFSGAPLTDISIDVVKGGSPFPWNSKGGLLASGNSSMGTQLDLAIDPCLPYLNLPKSTCDAIASELPVTYNNGLGLYLWNETSPDYPRIVQSPSVLSFTFVDPDNNSRLVNISVPFIHLNLTLDEPLVDKPTPYFPCNAASDGNYALGRAFLQDAFFGANLKTSVYFMSQAPGPNVNGESVAIMDNECRTLDPSNNDWVTSWGDYWTPLPGPDVETSQDNSSSSGSSSSHSSMTGTIAGATVGGVAGVALLAFIGFVARRYQRYGKGLSICGLSIIKDKPAAYYGANIVDAGDTKSPGEYWPQQPVPQAAQELPTNSGNTWQLSVGPTDQAAEMESPYTVHEMPGDYAGRNHY